MHEISDSGLVERALRGNHVAFRQLYYRHVDRVYALTARLAGPDADDVVQEVFLQAYRSLPRFRGEAKFSTWLHRIAINVGSSAARRRGRSREDPASDGQTEAYPGRSRSGAEDRLLARDALRRLDQVVGGLSHKNRVVFVLYELEGMTLKEIAAALGDPLFTVAGRLRRARLAVSAGMVESATSGHVEARR